MAFEVTLLDNTVEVVERADSYQQEGPMTTFFASDSRHTRLNSWSVKVASFRTDRVLKIRRVAGEVASGPSLRESLSGRERNFC
jgi:hypothetical protein